MTEPITLEALEKEPVFHYFLLLCRIPHPTFQEKRLSDTILAWAQDRGFTCRQDAYHNLYIRKPASAGREKEPAFLLQAHLDMVSQKAPHVVHDFIKDPIPVKREGDLLTTGGQTTLGADDGIGVALAMALLAADDFSHPEIEVLFTTAEEDDFSGALNADVSWFHAPYVINLDNAAEHHATTGSAGGCCVRYERPVTYKKTTASFAFARCHVGGMRGGHSGEDIHRGRGSAIELLTRMLVEAEKIVPLHLAELRGGSFRIAISRDAEAIIAFPADVLQKVVPLWEKMGEEFKVEYGVVNPELFVRTEVLPDAHDEVLTAEDTRAVLCYLMLAPQGIVEMNGMVPGVVQSSVNLGEARLEKENSRFVAVSEPRSSFASRRDAIVEKMRLLSQLFGGTITVSCVYPGWPDNPDSRLKKMAVSCYRKLYGEELAATPVHVGLECGFFLEKRPELDCISIGPDAGNLHSPQEYVSISSTRRVFAFLKELIGKAVE
jgi:dipeptidase D